MKRFIGAILIMLILTSIFTPIAQAQDYILGPGDVLGISVWGFDDLQLENVAVRPDGKIAFPLAGEIVAEGLSSGELMRQITERLNDQVVNPKVTVNIQKYRTTRVYVLGEIPKPGLYELEKQHNLLDAVSIAGGYTKDTAKKKVFIVKKDKPGEPVKVNLLDILQSGDLSQNHRLSDGDVVYLTHNGRLDFAKDIMPFITATFYVNEINRRN